MSTFTILGIGLLLAAPAAGAARKPEAAAPAAPQADTEPAPAAAVADALGSALKSRDPAKVGALLTPDAAVVFVVDARAVKRVPDEAFLGREQVRDFLDAYLPGFDGEMGAITASGDRASWTLSFGCDRFRRLGLDRVEVKTDVVSRGGKVLSLTWTAEPAYSQRLVDAIPSGNKAVVRDFYERVNRRDFTVLEDDVAAGFLQHTSMPAGPGREGLKEFYRAFTAAFPDFVFTLEDLVAEGDRVSARMTARFTHKGAFMGIAPTGNPVVVPRMAIFRLVGGKVIEHWDAVDRLGMLQQIGVVPRVPRFEASPGYDGFR